MADPVNIVSLYSGSGMLDEACRAYLALRGITARVLVYCEREAFAAWFLLDRMEKSALEPAPVFCGDLRDMDAKPLRGFVDILCASPPCQPYSSAGKRRGNTDERSHGDDGDGPLPHTVRIIGECRPALVFFENVPEWFTGGHFREFGEQLCDLGYDFAPPLFIAAEDVGAPHERERVFCLGWLADADQTGRRLIEQIGRADRRGVAGRSGEELGDAVGSERQSWPKRKRASYRGVQLGDAANDGSHGEIKGSTNRADEVGRMLDAAGQHPELAIGPRG